MICNAHHRCIETALSKAEAICLERKLAFTKLRRAVFSLIWESHVPPKAYDILERLKIKEPTAKPITIYRILDFLLENKLIHKLESQNSFLGCAHPGANHNCYFIICTKCHVVEEDCATSLLQPIYSSLNKNDFKVQHIMLEIQGTCKSCLTSRLSSSNERSEMKDPENNSCP